MLLTLGVFTAALVEMHVGMVEADGRSGRDPS